MVGIGQPESKRTERVGLEVVVVGESGRDEEQRGGRLLPHFLLYSPHACLHSPFLAPQHHSYFSWPRLLFSFLSRFPLTLL